MQNKQKKKSTASSGSAKRPAQNRGNTVRVRNQSVDPKKQTPPKQGTDRGGKHPPAKEKTLIPRSSKLIHQIMPFALFVLVLLTIVSFIEKEWLGLFGIGYHYLIFGLLGYGAFLIPAVLIYMAIFWKHLVDYRRPRIKILLAGLVMIFVSALIQVCVYSAKSAKHVLDVKTLFFRGDKLLGGGVIGGYIAAGSYKILSLVGSIIVIVAILAVLLMLFFGVTPSTIVRFIRRRRRIAAEKAAAKKLRAEEDRKKNAAKDNKNGSDNDRRDDRRDDRKDDRRDDRRDDRKDDRRDDRRDDSRDDRRDDTPDKKKTDDKKKNDDKYLDPTKILLNEDSDKDGVKFNGGGFDGDGRKKSSDDTHDTDTNEPHRAIRIKPEPRDGKGTDKDGSEDERKKNDHDSIVDQIESEFDEDTQKDKSDTAKKDEGKKKAKDDDGDEDLDAIPLDDSLDEYFPRKLPPIKRVVVDDEKDKEGMDELFGEDARQAKRERAVSINENGEYDGLDDEDGADDVIDAEVAAAVEEKKEEEEEKPYEFPPIDLLNIGERSEALDEEALNENMNMLEDTLASFKIKIREMSYSCGPTITRYELKPEAGIRVRSIANLVDDIAMSLATTGVRIEAPIPGKAAVGIEVPNPDPSTVYLRGLIDSQKFKDSKSRITACLGEDVTGNPIIFDIGKMPHLLVAGATGMGKSVCINSIILSLLYKATPKELKLILIDPKKVEFNIYKDIPHLFSPIVSDPKKAAAALVGAVNEMEQRFALIEEVGVRDIAHYNAATANDPEKPFMPHMVIIIDELADLMMTAPDEVESSICRLAQKARAAGIHIIIGTQRPSVDVITGLIKANIPSRIAFTVASQVDSRTIIDIAGAEKLIGRGDMLYAPVGSPKPARVQGAFVSEREVEAVVEYIKSHNGPVKYNEAFVANLDKDAQRMGASKKDLASMDDDGTAAGDGEDPKLLAAIELAVETGKISTSLMQRRLEVGYGRAAKIIDRMEELGYVSAPDGNKPRKILITKQDLMEMTVRGTNE